MATVAPGQISVHQSGLYTIVGLTGEHDAETAPKLADVLTTVVAAGRRVVVDCSATEFLDSHVLATLMRARASCAEEGGLTVVLGQNACVRRLFEVTGLLDALACVDDLDGVI